MMLQQKAAKRRTICKDESNPDFSGSRQANLHSPVEGLLRDLALVLHATAAVRQEMEAEQALYSAAS